MSAEAVSDLLSNMLKALSWEPLILGSGGILKPKGWVQVGTGSHLTLPDVSDGFVP